MKINWGITSCFRKLDVIVKRFQPRSKTYQLYVYTCLLTFCATSVYLLILWNYTIAPDRAMWFRFVQNKLSESMDSSEEIGCDFPNLDPYSEEVMKFSRNVSKITCEGEDWVDCYLSKCQVKIEILKSFRDIVCNYKDIIYVNDHYHYLGTATRVVGEDKYYLNISDHVKVSCTGVDKTGLGLLASRWFGHKAGFRPIVNKIPPGREDSLNVLIVAFDSTSRNGFIRRMPNSYRVLTEELRGTVFKGFHIVGDGTPATLFPLLSGKSELEHPDASKMFSNGHFLDPKLFIFHQLKADGYHTAYFEDMVTVGTFQYRYNGFNASPADHYLRAFFMEESRLGLKITSADYCLGATPQYLFMLNLTSQFMEMEGKKFCLTFIADISHDDFNMITAADDDFVEFLREFKYSEKFKNTLLIVMGDHGSRFSSLRETYQGKMEERLPFLSIVLPEKLVQQRPDALLALRGNEEVLVTPFDLHTTLLDIMGLKKLANEFKVPGSDLPRGMSLLEHIPKSRNCGQAAILPHWCVCSKWSNVSVSDPLHTRVGVFLAQFINNITLEQRELCAERTLTSIEWVMRHGTNSEILKYRSSWDHHGLYTSYATNSRKVQPYVEDYQVKIVMAPGRAVYEATMKYYVREDRFNISASEISRITAYKNEPQCASESHPHLNKYCYCKNTEVTTAKISSFNDESRRQLL